MLSTKHNVKSTLLCGSAELNKSFMFEAAIYWAEEGHRVVYITPTPLDSLPAACHDRSNPVPAAFKLMRFMYLETYEMLVEKLTKLHTFATLPTVLLIDDFDNYTKDYKKTEAIRDIHIAKMSALIFDTMNTCSRILGKTVYICGWTFSMTNDVTTYSIYFQNIWNMTNEEDTRMILLEKYGCQNFSEKCPSYRYRKLQDGTRVLKQIFYENFRN
nr:uncharacterized protein LOC116433118 isoform X2 [Nomia melanderi]